MPTPELVQELNGGNSPDNGPNRRKIALFFLLGALVAAISHLPWLLHELGVIGSKN